VLNEIVDEDELIQNNEEVDPNIDMRTLVTLNFPCLFKILLENYDDKISLRFLDEEVFPVYKLYSEDVSELVRKSLALSISEV
jgi:hypothetical protein